MEPQESLPTADVKWRIITEHREVLTHISIGPIDIDGKQVTILLIYKPDGIAALARNLDVAAETAISQQALVDSLIPGQGVQISLR